MGSKRAHFTCLCTPNGLGSFLGKSISDPFWTHFLSINIPFSRHFGILGGPQRATTSSKRARNTCFGIPCGPVSFLKKVIFLHPLDLVDPFWHPPLWATSCSLPQPTGPTVSWVGSWRPEPRSQLPHGGGVSTSALYLPRASRHFPSSRSTATLIWLRTARLRDATW